MAKEFIPSHPDELTPDWMTVAMRSAGVLALGARVTAVGPGDAIAGIALSGITIRLDVTYEPEGAGPATVIGKFASTDLLMRGLLESMDVYGREIAFYRGLATDVPLRVPRFLGGDCDAGPPASVGRVSNAVIERMPYRVHLHVAANVEKYLRASRRRYVLLLEDVGDALVYDMVEPPTPERLQPALEQLAHLHATFWGRADLVDHPATRPMGSLTPTFFSNAYDGICRERAFAQWTSWLTDDHRTIIDAAATTFADDLRTVNAPVTLVHGDPRSDNLLYLDDGVVLVDWAMTGYAHPGFDVAYLLGSSVRANEDPAVVRGLVEHYRASLAAEGKSLEHDELWSVVLATTRVMVLQMALTYTTTVGGYGEAGRIDELWAPRLFALLEHHQR